MAAPIKSSKDEYVELNDVEYGAVAGFFLGMYLTPIISLGLYLSGCGLTYLAGFGAVPVGSVIGGISGYIAQVRNHLDKNK